jgi:hypothetical protein
MLNVRLMCAAILVFLATVALAADRVQSGEWQTTLTLAGKPTVTKHCITAAEAKLMNGDVATLRKYLEQSTAQKTRGRCTVKNVSLMGDTTVVTISCGRTEVTGTTKYHGDRYESSSTDGTTVTGKRLGNCPAK